MSLEFPNRSRSYDQAGRRVRFSGYDNMFEISFFIELDALAKTVPRNISGENDYLSAFDAARARITDAAKKAYGRSKGAKAYTLTLSDFK